MKETDIAGRRFGRLVAIRRDGWSRSWHPLWLCRCDCGREVSVQKDNLTLGRTRSCGCLRRDMMKGNARRYGRPAMEPGKGER